MLGLAERPSEAQTTATVTSDNMAFWDELSSATGSPTGSAIVEDPFARAVRIYQMELANAQATAEARRNPAPNFGVDELTGSPFQLPALDARTPGPATGRRAFGDTEADIQREVIAPFEQFGDALMEPFQRGSRRGTERRAAAPRAPVVRGSAAGGYFTVDPVTGEAREIRAPIKAPPKPMTVGEKRDFYGSSTAMKELERQALAAEEAGASPEQLLEDFALLGQTPPYASIWAARMRPRVDRQQQELRASLGPDGQIRYSGPASQIEAMSTNSPTSLPEPPESTGTTNTTKIGRWVARVLGK